MLKKVWLLVCMFFERAKDEGFWKTLSGSLYSDERAIPVYIDLAALKPARHSVGEFGLELKMVTPETADSDFRYQRVSRKLKVDVNLKQGFRSFVLLKGTEIIGDIWYVLASSGNSRPHKDLDLLNVDISPQDVYAFDMFVSPKERGKDLTTAFMGEVLRSLKEAGHSKAYGYFEESNIPALWIHRLVGYKELAPVRIRRFFYFWAKRIELPPRS